MAKAIMIQGTMSNAGKSLIAAGLCRILRQDGWRVAPFKSQNMALNSYITEEGLEMGRAQVVQAEAAGVKPAAAMNPILLKPTSENGSQVIVNGMPVANMTAREYFAYKKKLIPEVEKAYKALAEEYDIIVIEGAGSPAEINLKQDDIVNMGMAERAGAPVLLVGDIDRGGVFAQLYGTVMLLEPEERKRVCGLIINKFRGDRSILDPGLSMIRELCKIPVVGVVPYLDDVVIEEEDSLGVQLEKAADKKGALIEIAVIRLPRISNFTDFQVFSCMDHVRLTYVAKAERLERPDLVILPGTKSTISDLLWMRQNGLEAAVLRLAKKGVPVFGICGGFQMLGDELSDPYGVESETGLYLTRPVYPEESGGGEPDRGKEGQKTAARLPKSVRGMGLLPVRTVFGREKTRSRTTGSFASLGGIFWELSGMEVEGYEIHMGETSGSVPPIAYVMEYQSDSHLAKMDGCQRGNVYGTYLHGIFDQEGIAKTMVRAMLAEKGIIEAQQAQLSFHDYKEAQYEKLADHLRESLDMEQIYRVMGLENPAARREKK